ncbi:signal recognition particle-docking protein FtsY [Caminicella sporogenes DSM 14501]|uniref:Signal recognition particle receptor FtsY n=1 Tax=Caminicella sporogenes DSM 14501 TaxID=1121266 RepID=A0A1M6LES0_9FIRM|nr:signal recognition particle-docking protein FtsY [Caminicella sporogenes]RKD27811.1 signal recognition particle-docking protein FtsY [Caminicella sporogenes]SHJ69713.1 signal recognition particle-docking protein FtsY [Caminicella sporogenes DSM 14501]
MLKKFLKKFIKNNDSKENNNLTEDNIVENDIILEEQEEILENSNVDTDNTPVYEKENIKEEVALDKTVEHTEDVEDANEESQKENNKLSFFSRLKKGLLKTRQGITEKIDTLLKSYKKIDEEFLEELEEILIMSDVGMDTTLKIMDKLREKINDRKISETSEVKEVLKEVMIEFLTTSKDSSLNISPSPAIILVIGVNGVGKTTSIGKIAYNLKSQGKKVLLAAGDTFRAAAIDQLKVWGERIGVNVVHQSEGSDPGAVVFDAIQAAKARKIDVLICDTAGRLHNKKNLMNELSKIFKIIDREYPEAKREVLLVLDATTGQNAIQQAKTFKEAANITGIVLTKLDGTAKGGVILGITSELDVPVKLIGIGEGKEDLQPFEPEEFIEALLSEN